MKSRLAPICIVATLCLAACSDDTSLIDAPPIGDDSTTFDVNIHDSTDMTITLADAKACTVTLGPVPAKTITEFQFQCTVPQLTPGWYYSGVIIDPGNQVPETNENNNVGSDGNPELIQE